MKNIFHNFMLRKCVFCVLILGAKVVFCKSLFSGILSLRYFPVRLIRLARLSHCSALARSVRTLTWLFQISYYSRSFYIIDLIWISISILHRFESWSLRSGSEYATTRPWSALYVWDVDVVHCWMCLKRQRLRSSIVNCSAQSLESILI